MDTPIISELHGSTLGRLYIKKRYPEFYTYLIERYKHIPWKNFSELLYCYSHNLSDRPKCKMCNNRVNFISMTEGYREYCSVRCMKSDPDIANAVKETKYKHFGDDLSIIYEKMKKTKRERYGDPCWTNIEKMKKTCMERYGVTSPMKNKDICEKSLSTREHIYGKGNTTNHIKTKQTCIKRYGVDNVFRLDEVKKKSKESFMKQYGVEYPMQSPILQEKSKQTRAKKYGDSNYNNRDKYKETSINRYGIGNPGGTEESIKKIKLSTLKKYGVEWYTQTQEYKEFIKNNSNNIQEKIYETKTRNHTFNTSSIEQEFKQWLDANNINYKYQYKSITYPFSCDFYFPDTDSYLEIQGLWTHGKHPFDPNSISDIQTLRIWESKDTPYYNNAIYVWTIKDPQKRNFAKEHNLNWYEVFTNDLNDIIKLNIW